MCAGLLFVCLSHLASDQLDHLVTVMLLSLFFASHLRIFFSVKVCFFLLQSRGEPFQHASQLLLLFVYCLFVSHLPLDDLSPAGVFSQLVFVIICFILYLYLFLFCLIVCLFSLLFVCFLICFSSDLGQVVTCWRVLPTCFLYHSSLDACFSCPTLPARA